MRIVKKGVMPNGIRMQLEDWSEDYPFFAPVAHIAAYLVARESRDREGVWRYPERGKPFRLSFYFGMDKSAELAFLALQDGEKALTDFSEYVDDKELFQYI